MSDPIKSLIAKLNKEIDLKKFKSGFRAMARIFDDRESKLIQELRNHTIASYKHYKLCRICDSRWPHEQPEKHTDACPLKGTK